MELSDNLPGQLVPTNSLQQKRVAEATPEKRKEENKTRTEAPAGVEPAT